jgi:hypothetical protein
MKTQAILLVVVYLFCLHGLAGLVVNLSVIRLVIIRRCNLIGQLGSTESIRIIPIESVGPRLNVLKYMLPNCKQFNSKVITTFRIEL